MRKRGIYMHRFKRNGTLTVLSLCRESTHIMKSVAKLDEDNANILIHCKEHLTDILNMRLFLVGNLYGNNLRKTVNERRNILTEHFGNDLKACFIRAVLHCIVQERGTNRVGIKPKLSNDNSHRNGMRYIRLTALTELSCVKLVSIQICLFYLFDIIIFVRIPDNIEKRLQVCVHNLS